LVLALGLVSCSGKDRVSLSAAITSADLQVVEGSLGTFLQGSIDIRLELGSNASGSTTADLESAKLLRASDDLELVPALPIETAPAPTELSPGQSRTWHLVLDATDPLATGLGGEICAEPVRVHASISDTTFGSTTSPSSADIAPEGCP
jgi:hypothetical protein